VANLESARTLRLAVLASLALAWLNFLLTTRWAHVAGALHGWRRPWYAAVLLVATVLVIRSRSTAAESLSLRSARGVFIGGLALLTGAFIRWFPPSSWTQIPFLDNWAPRFQSTVEGVALLRQGAVSGWNWFFLGGYHTSSDITQSLTVLGFLPMTLLGDALGFHILQLVLFLSIPWLVYMDLRHEEPRAWAPLAAGLTAIVAGNFSYMFIRSGDTNSVAGVLGTALIVVASHRARRGTPWGFPLLVFSVALTAVSHIGFIGYAFALVLLDAWCARDRGTLWRGVTALLLGGIAALPFVIEIVQFPDYFNFNNVVYDGGAGAVAEPLLRKIFYNVELLLRPGRWGNDYAGLTAVFLPCIAFVAWRWRVSRIGFYAAGVLLVVAMMRLNAPQFGYIFLRPIHLLALLTPAVVAWVILQMRDRFVAWALVAVVAVYMQVIFPVVPHVASVQAFNPTLVARITAAEGHLVLVENNPHRDMDASPSATSEPSAFGVHYEALLPPASGRRLYAGYWDGWQWSPWRGQTLAGGAILGTSILRLPPGQFETEMRRWGVRSFFVWSDTARGYLSQRRDFVSVWEEGRWREYRWNGGDGLSVVTASGRGELQRLTPLSADVVLDNVRAGDPVVVRTNFHPAWTAISAGQPVALREENGQLAFDAPASGGATVTLTYPPRSLLLLVCLFVSIVGTYAVGRLTTTGRTRYHQDA
jgi:hypothetical protein